MKVDLECEFGRVRIRYSAYPFFPASVAANPEVYADAIREVNLDGAPPTLRVGKELLFVPHCHRERLAEFARTHSIPTIRRYDVWETLLEPFLDTEFDVEHKETRKRELSDIGLDAHATRRIRLRVGPTMFLACALSWEWQYFGLFDVLWYMNTGPLFRGRYRKFYREAMSIALLSYPPG